MEQNLKNSNNTAGRVLNRLAAEKKKTVMAICLIVLMVFMWARMLSKKTPKTTSAAVIAKSGQTDMIQPDSQLEISFVELPNVKGRNDVLTRDFFTSNSWKNLINQQEYQNSGAGGVDVISGSDSRQAVESVAEKLKLEAIDLGQNPQAFINGKLLSVGDKLMVNDDMTDEKYEFEVTKIEQNMVFMKSGQVEVKLKLTQGIDVSD